MALSRCPQQSARNGGYVGSIQLQLMQSSKFALEEAMEEGRWAESAGFHRLGTYSHQSQIRKTWLDATLKCRFIIWSHQTTTTAYNFGTRAPISESSVNLCNTQTHTHTHIYIYICVCVCVRATHGETSCMLIVSICSSLGG